MQLRYKYSHAYPQTLETLRAIKERGYAIALVSNCTSYAEVSLAALELDTLFDHLSLSHLVGTVKPDPRIFQDACEALAVEPHECYFVGDGGGGEITASAALGMSPVLIVQKYSQSMVKKYTGQDFTIQAITKLLEII